jgi:hypothetical protein
MWWYHYRGDHCEAVMVHYRGNYWEGNSHGDILEETAEINLGAIMEFTTWGKCFVRLIMWDNFCGVIVEGN